MLEKLAKKGKRVQIINDEGGEDGKSPQLRISKKSKMKPLDAGQSITEMDNEEDPD